MSELGDIEAAIIGLLEGVLVNGEPAFASVSGHCDPDRKRAAASLGRYRQPAAYVMYSGRGRADLTDWIVGTPEVMVLISVRHLGGADRVRLGDEDHPGAFTLLGLAMQALDGASVPVDARLHAIDEQIVAADDRTIVYEQRYAIERLAV